MQLHSFHNAHVLLDCPNTRIAISFYTGGTANIVSGYVGREVLAHDTNPRTCMFTDILSVVVGRWSRHSV
jgi:hypothetical protein